MEGEWAHEVGQAFGSLADPVYWIAVTGAVLVAAVTGIIPGASGVLIMALSIPFIVDFFRGERAAIGLVMLASMTGVNNTLDSIPAVLLGQPGAATQVTFLEGHQLARQGKAAHTLGAIYAVSALGGIIGAVVLAILVPIIKPFVLSFGFPEIAAMAFFGIAMVSALSSGAMVKGLAAGALGVLFGTVGINPITGDVRFVFQQPSLWSGLPLIATTLGLFALPEMIDLSIARRPVAPRDAVINTGEVWRGARAGLSRWPIMIRQSIFGVLLGAIPGVGAAVIDWLSYAFGIFWSKDKSQFGKGSLDGVLFAESAQNSKEAGQAIPTLALGVPGGLAWAFVLIAMLAMDVTPGPQMLGRFADVTILLIITLAIGNFMVTILGILATGHLAKLTKVPYPVIGGIVIPISILTGVINMTNWLAIPIMFVFMGIGIIMKLFQWPRPPLLLGVILGPIIELNFQSAVNVHGFTGVLGRPLTVGLIFIAVATAYMFYRSGQNQAKAQQLIRENDDSPADDHSSTGTPPLIPANSFFKGLKLVLTLGTNDIRNFPVFLAIGGGTAFILSSVPIPAFGWPGFSSTSRMLPVVMSSTVILLASIQLFFNLREKIRGGNSGQADIMDLGMHSLTLPGARGAILLVGLTMILFLLATGIVGLRWGALLLAALLPIFLMSGTPEKPGVVAAVSGTFVAIALIGTGETIAYNWGLIEDMPYLDTFTDAAPMLAGLLVLGLIYVPQVRNFQPPATLTWLFSWRILAALITVSFVTVFQFIMADNILYMIWPEAALFEWIGREIWTPLFG